MPYGPPPIQGGGVCVQAVVCLSVCTCVCLSAVCIHVECMCVVCTHVLYVHTLGACMLYVHVCVASYTCLVYTPLHRTLPWHPSWATLDCVFTAQRLLTGVSGRAAYLMPQSHTPRSQQTRGGMALTSPGRLAAGPGPLPSPLRPLSTNPSSSLVRETYNKVGFLNPWQMWRWGCPSTFCLSPPLARQVGGPGPSLWSVSEPWLLPGHHWPLPWVACTTCSPASG